MQAPNSSNKLYVTGKASIMNLCTLVDKDDRVIGKKDRNALSSGDIYRITALWVVNSHKQVLLAQRVLTKKNDPGKWGPAVSGTIENDETYQQGVSKEATEELGITDTEFHVGPKLFIADNGHGQGYFCQTFVAYLDWPVERFKLQVEEVAAIQWFDVGTMLTLATQTPENFTVNFARSARQLTDFVRTHNL